jgi:hypothetical protein
LWRAEARTRVEGEFSAEEEAVRRSRLAEEGGGVKDERVGGERVRTAREVGAEEGGWRGV